MSTFVVTRRLYVEPWQADKLDRFFDMLNRMYNKAAKHCKDIMEQLYADNRYQSALASYKSIPKENEKERKQAAKSVFNLAREYHLTEYDIHAYLAVQKKESFNDVIGINIAQKVGTNLYKSVSKALFLGTKIHYRKKGQTDSFEDKRANSGIIFKENKGVVKVSKMSIRVKPIRKNDLYLQEAMTHKIKYCRIKREPFHGGYRYFLQIVMEGEPPKKTTLGKGVCGIDEGTSTVCSVTKETANFVVLADGVEGYEADIRKASVKYERRLRMNNPECVKEDGTFKKGCKMKHTNGSQKALMELKAAYRRKSEFIKQAHGHLTNLIAHSCNVVVKEPMNFKALARRSKDLKRSQKQTMIKKRDGKTQMIRKYCKRKRFGRSIGRRSPGLFNQMLEQKIQRYGGSFINVDSHSYRASQYDHTSGKYTKKQLSDRAFPLSDGTLVQRDLYSAYLLHCFKNEEGPNRRKCKKEFPAFLKHMYQSVVKIKTAGDKTGNFGLRSFDIKEAI